MTSQPNPPAEDHAPGPDRLRFGELAIARKLVSAQAVEDALAVQAALRERGLNVTLGAILHERGHLTLVQVGELLALLTQEEITSALRGYQVLELVATGRSGRIYRCRHEKLGRMVAIKLLSPEIARDRVLRDRIFDAARAAARFAHPGVVRVLGVGEAHGYAYVVTEWVDGWSLRAMMRRTGPMDGARALAIGVQVADALAYAAQAGVVHGDVRPENILVTAAGAAKLAKLGLRDQRDATVTRGGRLLGTPHYLAPEHIRGEPLDARSDLYALGATLFHALAGAPPFDSGEPLEIMQAHLGAPVPLDRLERLGVSAATTALLGRLLAKRREDRPADPAKVAAEIREIQAFAPRPTAWDTPAGGLARTGV